MVIISFEDLPSNLLCFVFIYENLPAWLIIMLGLTSKHMYDTLLTDASDLSLLYSKLGWNMCAKYGLWGGWDRLNKTEPFSEQNLITRSNIISSAVSSGLSYFPFTLSASRQVLRFVCELFDDVIWLEHMVQLTDAQQKDLVSEALRCSPVGLKKSCPLKSEWMHKLVQNGWSEILSYFAPFHFVEGNLMEVYVKTWAGGNAMFSVLAKGCSPRDFSSEVEKRLVAKGNETMVRIMFHFARRKPTNKSLLFAVHYNNLEMVKALVESGADPGESCSRAFRDAVRYNHGDIARYLYAHTNVVPTANDNEAVKTACAHRFEGLMDLLLNDPAVTAFNSE